MILFEIDGVEYSQRITDSEPRDESATPFEDHTGRILWVTLPRPT